MEGLLAILVGAFAVAVSPLVPVMRPAAKAAVKSGLALAGVATGAAAGGNNGDQGITRNRTGGQIRCEGGIGTRAGAARGALHPRRRRKNRPRSGILGGQRGGAGKGNIIAAYLV